MQESESEKKEFQRRGRRGEGCSVCRQLGRGCGGERPKCWSCHGEGFECDYDEEEVGVEVAVEVDELKCEFLFSLLFDASSRNIIKRVYGQNMVNRQGYGHPPFDAFSFEVGPRRILSASHHYTTSMLTRGRDHHPISFSLKDGTITGELRAEGTKPNGAIPQVVFFQRFIKLTCVQTFANQRKKHQQVPYVTPAKYGKLTVMPERQPVPVAKYEMSNAAILKATVVPIVLGEVSSHLLPQNQHN